jgi:hypothetical protein
VHVRPDSFPLQLGFNRPGGTSVIQAFFTTSSSVRGHPVPDSYVTRMLIWPFFLSMTVEFFPSDRISFLYLVDLKQFNDLLGVTASLSFSSTICYLRGGQLPWSLSILRFPTAWLDPV